MKKKILKIVLIVIILNIPIMFTNSSFCDVIDPITYKPNDISGVTKLTSMGNTIIGVIQLVGSFISLIIFMIIGIKYMFGSVEEKAEYKETFKPYLIGALMLFGITNILGIISDIVSKI